MNHFDKPLAEIAAEGGNAYPVVSLVFEGGAIELYAAEVFADGSLLDDEGIPWTDYRDYLDCVRPDIEIRAVHLKYLERGADIAADVRDYARSLGFDVVG